MKLTHLLNYQFFLVGVLVLLDGKCEKRVLDYGCRGGLLTIAYYGGIILGNTKVGLTGKEVV